MDTGLYRITRDVKNPIHDRRSRSGERSIGVFGAGELVRLSHATMTFVAHQRCWCEPGDRLYAAVAAALEPVPVRTYREYAAAADMLAFEHENILAELVSGGLVSLSDIEHIRALLDARVPASKVDEASRQPAPCANQHSAYVCDRLAGHAEDHQCTFPSGNRVTWPAEELRARVIRDG